jgi:hypothetical protein
MNVRLMKSVLLVAIAALALGTSAQASTITYTSTFDPDDVLFNNSGGSCSGVNSEDPLVADTVSGTVSGACSDLSYGHLLVGFSAPPDFLTSATLRLYFADDDDPSNTNSSGNPESVDITLNPLGSPFAIGEVALNNASNTILQYSVFSQILADGSLSVFLQLGQQGSGQNDFLLDRSELIGVWRDVPEPASLMLFGGGLAAAATRIRRRRALART